jgi:hypothetical protein
VKVKMTPGKIKHQGDVLWYRECLQNFHTNWSRTRDKATFLKIL